MEPSRTHGTGSPAQGASLETLRGKTIAILGYGNQGRAQALNLRDSGLSVLVGARPGASADQARMDGFSVQAPIDAAEQAAVVMFLLPDTVIPSVYGAVQSRLAGKTIGFAHGFAFHFGFLERLEGCGYFLVGPKGAGSILRARYESGEGLPAVFAVANPEDEATRAVARAYAAGIGCAKLYLKETTFKEETECDLFGEQAVLCGGLMELMQEAFETLTRAGFDPEMALLETCYEARLILDLWLKYGPAEMTKRISPTAFYGGLTRGKRVLGDGVRERMETVLGEIQSGDFAREWMKKSLSQQTGFEEAYERLKATKLNATYQRLSEVLSGRSPRPKAEPQKGVREIDTGKGPARRPRQKQVYPDPARSPDYKQTGLPPENG